MIGADGVEMVEVREAASLVGRTPETIRRWVWSGRISARKSGNRLLLERSEVLGAVSATSGTARPTLSLAEWVTLVEAREGRGQPGNTASDLVLEDRAGRGDGDARR